MSPNSCIFSYLENLVLLVSPSAAFLHLIFGPYIFNFLVKFVSPNSSTTRISPIQHPDNAKTSCFIILWTLISLCKHTLRSSSYSPFEILYGRPFPVGEREKLEGDHQQLAGLEMSQHLQALEKSSTISPGNLRKGHPFVWAIGFIPISQEMKYGLMIGKKKKNNTSASLDRPSHSRPGKPYCC